MKLLRGQLLLALGASIWLAGCASIGPPVAPSLELPRPPSDLHAARKGEKVTLTWSIPARTTDRQSVRYLGATRICRSLDPTIKQCQIPVGDAPPPADFASARESHAQKLTASFTDTLPSAIGQEHPTVSVTYAVEVLNTAGRSAGISNQVHVPLVPTLPPFGGFSAQPTAPGVLITWQCPPAPGRGRADTKYLFRIYRHSESSPSATRIAELDATECAAGPSGLVPLSSQPSSADTSVPKEEDRSITSFLDQTFEWENTYFYRGAVVSVINTPGTPAVEVEGDDTLEVKVFAHDIFPPAVPSGLQAVFSGPGQQPFIDLIWAPVPDADLAGYNIYRREEGTGWEKLNTEPVRMPAYRDTNVVSGKNYAYSIAAVDVRGNESGRSEEGSESVP